MPGRLVASLLLLVMACEGDAADQAKQAAKKVADTATEVKNTAVETLRPYAEKLEGGIESVIVNSKELAQGTAKVAGLVADAVDSDTNIMPIYQDIGDEAAQAKVDAAIKGMPRTEVIDGVTVGFKDMVDTDGAHRTSESGYLVVWRKDDKLIGFVIRRKLKIDLDKLADVVRKVNSGL